MVPVPFDVARCAVPRGAKLAGSGGTAPADVSPTTSPDHGTRRYCSESRPITAGGGGGTAAPWGASGPMDAPLC